MSRFFGRRQKPVPDPVNPDLPVVAQWRWWIAANHMTPEPKRKAEAFQAAVLFSNWEKAHDSAFSRNSEQDRGPKNPTQLALALGIDPAQIGRRRHSIDTSAYNLYVTAERLVTPLPEFLPDYRLFFFEATALLCPKADRDGIRAYLQYWQEQPLNPRKQIDPTAVQAVARELHLASDLVERVIRQVAADIDRRLSVTQADRDKLYDAVTKEVLE